MVVAMVVVAWVSRHPPLPAQVEELKRLLGEVKIEQIAKTYRDAKEVFEEIKRIGAKVAVVVLPLSMIAQLLPLAKQAGIELWMAKMVGLHECEGPGKCRNFSSQTDVWLPLHGSSKGRHMRFSHFERIKEVKVITEPLGVVL